MNKLLLAFSLFATQMAYGATTTAQALDGYAAEYDLKHSEADHGVPVELTKQTSTPHLGAPEPMSSSAYLEKLKALQKSTKPSGMVREFYVLLQEAHTYEASITRLDYRFRPETLSEYAYKIADHFEDIRTSLIRALQERTDFESEEERERSFQPFIASSQFLNTKLITATLTLGMINLVQQAAGHRKAMAHEAGDFDAKRSYEYLHDSLFTHEKEQCKKQCKPLRLRVREQQPLAKVTEEA